MIGVVLFIAGSAITAIATVMLLMVPFHMVVGIWLKGALLLGLGYAIMKLKFWIVSRVRG